MSKEFKDLYIPATTEGNRGYSCPNTTQHDPPLSTLEQFQRYSATITGDMGDIIQRCHKHLDRFLSSAQEAIQEESGHNPSRLGRPRKFLYGNDSLEFQVFNYKGADTVSIREDRFTKLLTDYDLFHETMKFMERKVTEGNLGIFKNSFTFIHKPLKNAADLFDQALDQIPVEHTTILGKPADPNYVQIIDREPCDEYDPGTICRIIKPGYAYEGREIQEGVVVIAEKK